MCSECQLREDFSEQKKKEKKMNALLIIVLVLFINKSSSDEYFRIDLGKDVTFSCLFPHEYQLNQVSRMKSFSLSLALLMIKTAKNCGLLKKSK